MKITTIKYEQLFPTGVYQNQRLGVEINIDDGDFSEIGIDKVEDTKDVIAATFSHAKELVESAFKQMNPNVGEVHTVDGGVNEYVIGKYGREAAEIISTSPPPSKDSRLQQIANDIRSCKEIKVLESYRLIAKTETELLTAYNETMEKLTK